MSAYIVSVQCMDQALTGIQRYAKDFGATHTFMGMYLDDPQRIGEVLWALNERAVNGRYPHALGDGRPAGWRFTSRPLCGWMQQYKSLECVLYQCSEDITKDDPALLELEALTGIIARALLSRTPEYNNAQWG